MKKKILLIFMLTLLIIPISSLAAGEAAITYPSLNLKETLAAEEIELKNTSYKEDDKQVTIYLFRGTGCQYCRAFLNYLNSISEEYGKYFKLVSYDVWTSSSNASLLEEVSEFLGQGATGVPYIIIGDQVFGGYSEASNDAMETAIKEQYDSKDKYDVFEELEKYRKEEKRREFFNSGKFAAICNIIAILLATIVLVLLINNKTKHLERKLNSLEAKLAEKEKNNKEHREHKEHKEETKKSKK